MKETIHTILTVILLCTAVVAAQKDDDGRFKEKTFTVTKGGLLDVALDGGDVRLSTWDRNEIAVKIEYVDEEEIDDLKMTQSGNTVRIVNRHGWGYEGTRLMVTIPTQFDVTIETTHGDITLRDKLIGTLDVETSAGNIRMDDIEGEVRVRTSGGDIRTGKITGNASLNTSGGDIDLRSITGELALHTSGGNITLGDVGKSLKASTSGGDIMIGDVGSEAVVSTSGGNIVVGKVSGRVDMKTSGGDIQLKGGSGSIRAATSGGDVLLERISGSVEARTAGGEIRAELTPSGNGRSRLSSAAGEITLILPENAKATIEARIRIQGRWRDHDETYEIRSDFPSQTKSGNREEKEIRSTYVINGGGETIVLETVNSDINIRKR